MLYVIECRDRPGLLQLRLDTRPAHLEFLEGLGGDLVLAGPFLDGDEKPCGSLVIIKAQDMAAAEAVAARDPYAQAGLFESVEVRPWVWALNKPAEL